jgi:hypothetical protein
VEGFVRVMEVIRDELIEAEKELNAVYGQIKADARRRLGRLYNDGDYPAEIRGLFKLEWDFPSVEPPSYLMRLHPDIYQQEQERISHRFEEAVQLAEQAFVGEFAQLVSHLTERLSSGPDGERKTFRNSAVTNLVEFFERFKQLGIQSNAQLDQLIDHAQRLVQGVEPQALRNNDGLRQHMATQLAGVQSVLDGLMVDRPRRRIIRQTQQEEEGGGS